MLKSSLSWFMALSSAGKAGVIVATFMGLSVVSAATGGGDQPKTTSDTKTPSSETKKKASKITHKTITTTEEVPFITTNVDDNTIDKGVTKVTTEGVNGIKTHTFDVSYEDGEETSRKEVGAGEVTTQPINKVVAIGTYVAPQKPTCDPNYTPCVPVVSYDLDCPDIGFSVTVIGTDTHRFDGNDNDGQGCESY